MLGPGHPALDRAADDVLGRGDAGCAHVPWPTSWHPPIEALQLRARSFVPLDRGRLDVAAPLSPGYLPVLRAGALATYALSLDQRVQERLEVWVDARTGLRLEARVQQLLGGCTRLREPDSPHPRLAVALAAASAGAHSALEDTAGTRLSGYARQVGKARQRERACAEAYFEAALDTLARRRVSASEDRRAGLDGQAEATRAERERRLHEIDESYRPSVELRPFRLHLLWVPALLVSGRVRLGAVTHDLPLAWLLAPIAGFAPARCPTCGSNEPLSPEPASAGARARADRGRGRPAGT